MAKIKRRLTHDEEFQVMKLVLDKFLWLGTAFVGWGLYQSIINTFQDGLWFIVSGAVIMLAFAWIVLREFEQHR
jgi:hypothetical protein